MKFWKNRPLLMAGVASAAVTPFSVAHAQDDESSGDQVGQIRDVITVTARQREENVQDTPVTVTAFTEAQIERIGVQSMRDYAKLVPNLQLVETQNSTFTFINIRGISQFRNTDPSVAVVIDGVLTTSPIGLSQELFDIQQIEVLKGPQGALYGRNAMGGAINITTKRPTNEFEGFARAGYGNGDSGKAQFVMSGPLREDVLLARVATSFYTTDGVRENVTLGKPGDNRRNFSTRGRLLWLPSDNFEADFRVSYSEDDSSALGFIDVSPVFHETAPGSGVSLGTALGIPGFQPFLPNGFGGPITGASASQLFVAPGASPFIGDGDNIDLVPLQVNLNGIEERRLYNVSFKLDYDLGDLGDVTSITSYDKAEDFAIGENPPRAASRGLKNTQYRENKQWSQELRLTSKDDQRLRWIFGGYLQFSDTFLSTTVQMDSNGRDTLENLVTTSPFATPAGVCSRIPFLAGGGSPFDPAAAFPFDGSEGDCAIGFDGDQGDNFAYAAFGQINFDLTDSIELSFSGRYDRDERDQITQTPDLFLTVQGNPVDVSNGTVRSANFDSFQPKGTIRWRPLDGVMLFASYAEGFRSGGFNRPGVQALADANRPTNPTIPNGIFDIYPQQDTQGFDTGVKFSSSDGRFTINAAGFVTTVDNLQTFSIVNINNILSQTIIPVDEVKLKGVEVDTVYNLSDTLSFNAGFGWTDSKITKDTARGNTVGNKAPQTPDTTLNVGFQYEQPFVWRSMDANFFLRADYRRVGDMHFNPENFAVRDPVNTVDLRAGVELVDNLRIEGWVRNLGDENFCQEVFNPLGICFPGKLREYGFELTKRF